MCILLLAIAMVGTACSSTVKASTVKSSTTTTTSGARRSTATPQRILVTGDSAALTLGGGIKRWGRRNGITVVDAGSLGCTLMDNNLAITFAGVGRRSPDSCRTRENWPLELRRFRPDLVIVLLGAWDVYNMSWDNGRTWSWAGQPAFDQRYLSTMRDASNRLASDGARVLWLTPPCFGPHPGDDNPKSPWYDPTRVTALGTMLDTVATETHQLVSNVIHDANCPVDYTTRPDGVHFSAAGANAMMPTLGPAIQRVLTS